MAMLKRVEIRGFRSIREMDLELRPLNVLIGANGSGKSNLISFFKMLNEMTSGRLQQYIATTGRAQSILHFGPKETALLTAHLEFELEGELVLYAIGFAHGFGDTLTFAEETVQIRPRESAAYETVWTGTGHIESGLSEHGGHGNRHCQRLWIQLNHSRVFHFHDTSSTARVRQYCYADDARPLLHDAANLASVLFRLRRDHQAVYQRIVGTIRLIAPFFDDFDLAKAESHDIILNWRHRDSDLVFGPHQLSDGTLRAICLVTLLLQPAKELPELVIVDEPELGLHPYALSVVASLFKAAAQHTQILMSTQSSGFLDYFDAEDVVVVERDGRASRFTRVDAQKLEAWLYDYSLGEVWEKNVIGGGPH